MNALEAIRILERVDICANAAETARDMAISALRAQYEREMAVLEATSALPYMMKQAERCRANLTNALCNGAPAGDLLNIRAKLGYYELAIKALETVEKMEVK